MEVKEKKDSQVVGPDPAYQAALQKSIAMYGPGLEKSPLMVEHRAFVGSQNGHSTSMAITAKKPIQGTPMK